MNQADLCGLVLAGRPYETVLPRQYGRPIGMRTIHARPAVAPPPPVRDKNKEQTTLLLRCIEAHPGAQIAELLALTGAARHCLTGNIGNLLRRGSLRHEGERGKFRYYSTGKAGRKSGGRGPDKW